MCLFIQPSRYKYKSKLQNQRISCGLLIFLSTSTINFTFSMLALVCAPCSHTSKHDHGKWSKLMNGYTALCDTYILYANSHFLSNLIHFNLVSQTLNSFWKVGFCIALSEKPFSSCYFVAIHLRALSYCSLYIDRKICWKSSKMNVRNLIHSIK